MQNEKILITCALPYVNNVPHIGNIAGSHLPADIFARFCRAAGRETLFIGGSDEHGTPIEVAAEGLGVSPQELCDKYYKVHKEIYDWLDISYDNFSRTSLPEHHSTTREFFNKVQEAGFISEGTLRLPYCEHDKRTLPDRYVEGTCPKCGYDSAKGDQCESCSTLLNPDELKSPRCTICGSTPVIKEVKHLFLKLDKLQSDLEKWIKDSEDIWSKQVVNVAMGWIKEGLKPRCITRDIKWGVKVPVKGYEDRVFYVWFDAPIGYLSSTREWAKKTGKPDEWKKYWQSDAKIFHFIGKDNIPFHTIFWPGMLMANGSYSLPNRVVGLQYLNYEGGKISKSKNRGIFCENLPTAGLDPDLWRFYLTFLIPETDDTEWKWGEFRERINNELVANLGNFIYRTLSFIESNFDGMVPAPDLTEEDRGVLDRATACASEFKELMWDNRIRDGLRKVLELSDMGNKYFQKNEPWKAVKSDRERAATVLYVCANLCYDIAVLLSPFLPKSAERICGQLGVPLGDLGTVGNGIKSGQKLKSPKPVFLKLDGKTIDRLKKITSRVTRYEEMFGNECTYEDFEKLHLKTAKILSVNPVKGADRLLKLRVDVGGKERQLVAGIADNYKKKELLGKTIIIVSNMKPATIKGVKSEGMLLAAVDGDTISILTVDKEIKSGSRVE
ncbi:MAG: methionine--tRNA ligase [Candidatus Hydrothermarchaeaceae archaeon]